MGDKIIVSIFASIWFIVTGAFMLLVPPEKTTPGAVLLFVIILGVLVIYKLELIHKDIKKIQGGK